MRGSVIGKFYEAKRSQSVPYFPMRRKRSLSRSRYMPSRRKMTLWALALIVGAFAVNWIYQVVRKPAELLFPVAVALETTPTETWREYGALFRKYSTLAISAELLAA